MKYSYNWLKELSNTKMSPEEMKELLLLRSFEVESLERVGEGLDNVIVGKILEIQKHPNADKLRLTKVDVGSGKILDIVCGAPNIAEGDKIPVAMVGAKLPNGLEIKEAEIRGEKSFGMLCAKDELGLGEDHAGVLILDSEAELGVELKDHLNLQDAILEVDVLPNRAHDCLSYVGMSREIAALVGHETDYDYDGLELPKTKSKKLKVEIADEDLCLRYVGAVMEKIEVKESPQWMQSRLLIAGIRPINNVVDATNYVMLELGQPMHAFDAAQIADGRIVVRRAKIGEKIVLLDGTEKILDENNLLIADSQKPLAVAGVMGGLHSGINENTKTIILESANFNATSIRKTRTKLNLKTDASDHFEKEIDPNLAEKAMMRVIEILEHIADGKLEGVVDEYPKVVKSWKIKLDLAKVDMLLGEKIPAKKVAQILKNLGMQVDGAGSRISVEVPTYRIDLKTQEDLIEEIGRVYGYENIASQPLVGPLWAPRTNDERFFERKAKDILAGLKFDEVYNYSFYSQKDMNHCRLEKMPHLELANPMNPDQQFMRVSLVPNLLKNVVTNLKNFKNFNIFESGRVYPVSEAVLPDEKKIIMSAMVLEEDRNVETFFAAKGAASDFLKKLGVTNFEFNTEGIFPQLWHPTRSAQIVAGGERIGCVGEISPLVLADYKINKRVAMAKFEIASLMKFAQTEKEFMALRKYPIVVRDLSLLSDKKVAVAEIKKTIQSVGGELILNIDLFDIFHKEDKNSFAFHIGLGALDRTLESAEVEMVMQKIISTLEQDLKIEIRK